MTPPVALNLSALTGTWKNTNAASSGITRFDIDADGGALWISAKGRNESWDSTPGHPYAVDNFEARHALAFNCTFTIPGQKDVRLQANIKAGVLVVVFLTRFHDQSGPSNFFVREFYYRSAQ